MFRILCGIVFAVIASSKAISAPLWACSALCSACSARSSRLTTEAARYEEADACCCRRRFYRRPAARRFERTAGCLLHQLHGSARRPRGADLSKRAQLPDEARRRRRRMRVKGKRPWRPFGKPLLLHFWRFRRPWAQALSRASRARLRMLLRQLKPGEKQISMPGAPRGNVCRISARRTTLPRQPKPSEKPNKAWYAARNGSPDICSLLQEQLREHQGSELVGFAQLRGPNAGDLAREEESLPRVDRQQRDLPSHRPIANPSFYTQSG